MKVKELRGTEKQIKWAEEIRKNVLEIAEENNLEYCLAEISEQNDSEYFIKNFAHESDGIILTKLEVLDVCAKARKHRKIIEKQIEELQINNNLHDMIFEPYNDCFYNVINEFRYNDKIYKIKKHENLYFCRVSKNKYNINILVFNKNINENDIKSVEEKLQINF